MPLHAAAVTVVKAADPRAIPPSAPAAQVAAVVARASKYDARTRARIGRQAMNLLLLGKFPPITGGVSTAAYWTAHEMVQRGWNVTVVTNAGEVEPGYRAVLAERGVPSSPGCGSLDVEATSPMQPR